MESAWTPLIIAVEAESHQIARHLLEAGASVDDHDLMFRTALHYAISRDDVRMTKLLLGFGASPHARDSELMDAVLLACASASIKVLQELAPSTVDLQTRDVWGNSPLWNALKCGEADTALFVLNRIDLNDLSKGNRRGEPAMTWAFKVGETSMLTALLNSAPNPNVYTPGESNVLTSAIVNQNTTSSLMKMLLKRLPQEILPTLLKHHSIHGGSPLHAACTLANPSVQLTTINMLLDLGADLNMEAGEYGTPLTAACAMGRFQAVKLLVRRGASLVCQDEKGQTFSALRAAEHFPEIIRWLLVQRHIECSSRLLTNGGQ